MLKPISEVMGSRVVDLDNSQTLGEVINWVINPDKKQISALLVKPNRPFARSLAIVPIDIVEYGPKIVVVRNDGALVAPKEILHLPKLMRKKHRVLGNPVVTQAGKKLGSVDDLLFETIDASIQKIYVCPGLLGIFNQPDLILGVDKIIAIESNRIVVQDDSDQWETVKKTATVPTSN
ncbi:MAG: PRC-barrel domain-containing protein [Patescibacteria group bacterium]